MQAVVEQQFINQQVRSLSKQCSNCPDGIQTRRFHGISSMIMDGSHALVTLLSKKLGWI
jgi:hypothetical protein